jgi:hypothetical protein
VDLNVMAGLVPAIQAAPMRFIIEFEVRGLAWIPGTRPGMTATAENPFLLSL